jgi:membrane protease YdiL (CAAX protease family)
MQEPEDYLDDQISDDVASGDAVSDDAAIDEYEDNENGPMTFRNASGDPLFGLLIAAAVSIGLTPLIGTDADMRYTLCWALLALFGVTSWLIGNGPRIDQEKPDNLAWGMAFGLILGLPVLAFGGSTLSEITELIFRDMKSGTVLAYLVFVMPLAETLFFRGLMQENSTFWITGLISTAWSLVLFFPLMNRGPYPLIGAVIFLGANTMYSYVRERNGLAAAWLCQISVNIMVFFIPFAG